MLAEQKETTEWTTASFVESLHVDQARAAMVLRPSGETFIVKPQPHRLGDTRRHGRQYSRLSD